MTTQEPQGTGQRRAPEAIGAEAVLAAVGELADELEPGRGRGARVRLDSALGTEVGLDSLARAELLGRLEERFGVTLPQSLLAEAESPADLLAALEAAAGAAPGASHPPPGAAATSCGPDRTASATQPEVVEPVAARTLLEVLDFHAAATPERRHILFLETGPGEGAEQELTYGALRDRSDRAAAALLEMGLAPGERVGLMLPTGLEYFVTFLGALRAGGVPVPMYPPMRKSQVEDHLRRQAAIMASAQVRVLVTFDDVLPLARLVAATLPDLERVVTADSLVAGRSDAPRAARPPARPPVRDTDIAFLQYTSGSTGTPKGVILSHTNLLANLRSIGESVRMSSADVVVSWLPLYHDMGLIGAWMGSLYYGSPLVLMSPLAFLSRPQRWLWAIHRHRGTLSAAPNFAYELCLAKTDDAGLEGLDLSSWRLALNGAEPVSPRAVEGFPERFRRHGFNPQAMMPVYGLAESSLAVAFTPPGRGARIDTVDRERFQRAGTAAATAGDSRALRFVSCGRPIPRHEVRFVDDAGRPLGERRQGRLQFRGPSVTAGYFRNPEATERLVRPDGWRESGDLGYLADGEIYLTGRAKDLIIRAGRNVHPQEVEDAVGDVDGVRRGCVAAFAVADDDGGGECMVVMAESRLAAAGAGEAAAREALRERIEAVTLEVVGIAPDRVVLVPPRTVPKTSSGKIRRSAARQMVETGALGGPRRALWWQVVRLALSGVLPRLRARLRRTADAVYALWFWTVLALVALPLWPLVWALPLRALRRRLVRGAIRFVARATGTRVTVDGLEHLSAGAGPWVFIANHASYLDGLVLGATLPPDAAYVVKSELAGRPFLHLFLRRIGCVFVERYDPSRGEEESGKALRALGRGDHLVIFPEGTLRPTPGLQRFHMGAFLVAARAGAAVVPVVLGGTRAKLRGGSWWPRPGDVSVTVCPPEAPAGTDWSAAVDLRDRVRRALLERLAEPDLA